MAERVAVFLDFQNVPLSGHGLFESYGLPLYRCVPDPAGVADLIGQRRSRASEVTAVRVYQDDPGASSSSTTPNATMTSCGT